MRYSLSYRDLEEMILERWLKVDHTTASSHVILLHFPPDLGICDCSTVLNSLFRTRMLGRWMDRIKENDKGTMIACKIRFESAPAQQCQIDWGHFGSISYGKTNNRKLYCMAVAFNHSRMLYLELTHSQRQETLHRCLLNAFCFFKETPRELVHEQYEDCCYWTQRPIDTLYWSLPLLI